MVSTWFDEAYVLFNRDFNGIIEYFNNRYNVSVESDEIYNTCINEINKDKNYKTLNIDDIL